MGRVGLVRLVIPGDPCLELSPNRAGGRHWAVTSAKRNMVKQATLFAWMEVGSPVFSGAVTVRFTVHRGRVVDPDNALAALRDVVNGLKGRLFADDSARWVEYLPIQFVTGRRFGGREAKVFCDVWEREEAMD